MRKLGNPLSAAQVERTEIAAEGLPRLKEFPDQAILYNQYFFTVNFSLNMAKEEPSFEPLNKFVVFFNKK